jgi:hypothetical protein
MDDSEPKAATAPRRGWLRSHVRLLGVLVALLLLYTLGGFLLAPHLARNAILDYVPKNLAGRHASLLRSISLP